MNKVFLLGSLIKPFNRNMEIYQLENPVNYYSTLFTKQIY